MIIKDYYALRQTNILNLETYWKLPQDSLKEWN